MPQLLEVDRVAVVMQTESALFFMAIFFIVGLAMGLEMQCNWVDMP